MDELAQRLAAELFPEDTVEANGAIKTIGPPVPVLEVADGRATVTLEQGELMDDSIESERFLFEVEIDRGAARLVRAGTMRRCRPGRGPQTWTTQTCR